MTDDTRMTDTAENDALTGVLADEIRMYAHAHGSWLPIDLARNLTKQLRAAGWRVIPPGTGGTDD